MFTKNVFENENVVKNFVRYRPNLKPQRVRMFILDLMTLGVTVPSLLFYDSDSRFFILMKELSTPKTTTLHFLEQMLGYRI